MFSILNLDPNRIVCGFPNSFEEIENIIIFIDNNDIESKIKIETAIQKTKSTMNLLKEDDISWCNGLLIDGSSDLIFSYEKYNVIKNIKKINIISIFDKNLISNINSFKETIISKINSEIEQSGKLFLSYEKDVVAQPKQSNNVNIINNKDKKKLSEIERKERTKKAFLEIIKKKENKDRKSDKKTSPFGLKNVNKSNKSR